MKAQEKEVLYPQEVQALLLLLKLFSLIYKGIQTYCAISVRLSHYRYLCVAFEETSALLLWFNKN